MHRDPVATVTSGASLNTTLWRMHADDVDPARVGRQWLERMAFTNRRALAVRDRMPDAARRFTDIWFRDAVSDPLLQVERVYRAVGAPLADDARDAMRAWLAQDARQKLATHRYTPNAFGLSEGEIRAAFVDYTSRFIDPAQD
jgi:hypothetical protein